MKCEKCGSEMKNLSIGDGLGILGCWVSAGLITYSRTGLESLLPIISIIMACCLSYAIIRRR